MFSFSEPSTWLNVVKSLGQLGIVVTGALLPTMGVIQGCNQSRLATLALKHDIQMSYFKNAVDPTLGLPFHSKVMRFLAISGPDAKLSNWAEEEKIKLKEDEDLVNKHYPILCSKRAQLARTRYNLDVALSEGKSMDDVAYLSREITNFESEIVQDMAELNTLDSFVHAELQRRLILCGFRDTFSYADYDSADDSVEQSFPSE